MKASRAKWCVGFVLALQASLLAWGAWSHSPTVDEVTYLPAGIRIWTTGEFQLARVSPPLVRFVAAAPLVTIVSPETDWCRIDDSSVNRAGHNVGRDFVRVNGGLSFWYFTLARWACIPFSLLGTLVCYRWSTALYGTCSGVLAATMWCFSPNLLAHGQLVTADVAVTSLGVASTYAFWRWLKEPGWWRAGGMGLLLGLCQLSKLSGLVFVAVWPLLWLIDRWISQPACTNSGRLREIVQLSVAIGIAFYLVNVGFLFQGTGTRLEEYKFVSAAGTGVAQDAATGRSAGNRFADRWVGQIPVPLPRDYVLGIDAQRKSLEGKQRSYLRGHSQMGGWWYFYLYGLAVKVPLGLWLLVASACAATFFTGRRPTNWGDELCLIVPTLFILVVVSSHTGFSHHLRYALPMAPFVIIWASKVGRVYRNGHWAMRGLVSVSVAWLIASSMYVYPHSLSYFNELAGGPRNGHHHLINSNIDWSQDLLYLRDWLADHPEAKPLAMAFYGEYSPSTAGIDFALPLTFVEDGSDSQVVPERRPGWYAISVNYLHGHQFPVFDEKGVRHKIKQPYFADFADMTPVAMAGYSIYVYRLTEDDISRQFQHDVIGGARSMRGSQAQFH